MNTIDAFAWTPSLNYRKKGYFSTITSVFFSLPIILIFIFLVFKQGASVIYTKKIYSTQNRKSQVNPEELTFTIDNKFLIAVSIPGLDFTKSTGNFFTIDLAQKQYFPQSKNTQSYVVPLSPCTEQHFNIDGLTSYYQQLNASTWLCPPIGQKFEVKNKINSKAEKYIELYVKRCNPNLSQSCASDKQLAEYQKRNGPFILSIPFINTMINPRDEKYRNLYLQDKNFFYFTTRQTIKANMYLEPYNIASDSTILPQTPKIKETGFYIKDQVQHQSIREVIDNKLVHVQLTRTSSTVYYTRTYRHIDQFLSYIGGLIEFIAAFFFIIKNYNSRSFLIDLASRIYNVPKLRKEYNLLHYVYSGFMNLIGKKSTVYNQYLKEITKDLSVELILKRIIYLEYLLTGKGNKGSLYSEINFENIIQMKKVFDEEDADIAETKSKSNNRVSNNAQVQKAINQQHLNDNKLQKSSQLVENTVNLIIINKNEIQNSIAAEIIAEQQIEHILKEPVCDNAHKSSQNDEKQQKLQVQQVEKNKQMSLPEKKQLPINFQQLKVPEKRIINKKRKSFY